MLLLLHGQQTYEEYIARRILQDHGKMHTKIKGIVVALEIKYGTSGVAVALLIAGFGMHW
jgi:hypothetical protein